MNTKNLIDILVKSGSSQAEIAELLGQVCHNGDLEPAITYMQERFASKGTRSLSTELKAWVEQQEGWFDLAQLDRELGLASPQLKSARRKAIQRLKDEGVIEASRSSAGKYRLINTDADEIDWQNADLTQKYNLTWGFPIHKLCYLVPGNLVVLAGSSNSGKTALLMDFAARNMWDYEILYFSSEMGGIELAGRIAMFEKGGITPAEDWQRVVFRERSRDFADVVEPGKINIIDYLELTDNFYAISGMMLQIHEKLAGQGLAIIAVQKEPKAELGRGGQFGMEKPRLYLTMDANKLTIKKAKNWVDPAQNPNGRAWTFQGMWGGCKFLNIMEATEENR